MGDDMEVDGPLEDPEMDEDMELVSPTKTSGRWERFKVMDASGNWNNKYQKEKGLIYLLPYSNTIDQETDEQLSKLLVDLGKCVKARDFSVGLGLVLHSIISYIDAYGRKITKQQHVDLINLLVELLTMETMPIMALMNISHLLQILLSKQTILTKDDIVIQWRPLYETLDRWIYHRKYSLSHNANAKLEHSLKDAVYWANLYFPKESFGEIVEEFMPYLCPTSNKMTFGLEMLRIFLPFKNQECDDESVQLIKFLLGFYDSWNNHPIWEWRMMSLLSTAAYEMCGRFDWNPYIPEMYARLMRNLDLPVFFKKKREAGSSGLCKLFESASVARWIVSTLGNNEVALQQLKMFLKSVETYYNPANAGKWTITLASLLRDLGDSFVRRVRRERYFEKERWWRQVPPENNITEADIDTFVETIRDLVLDFYLDLSLGGFVLQPLSVLRPAMVIPAVMDKYSGMVETLTESKKYMTTMRWVMVVANVMVAARKEEEGFDGRHLVLPLANSLLPAIDSNDMTKTLTALISLSMIMNHITLVDCSALADKIEDDVKREICLGTAGLDDFVLQLLDRVFVLIENRSHENTRMADSRTATAATIEDLSLQRVVWGLFRPLATHASTPICQLAVNKVIDFVFDRVLEVDVSGKNFAMLCQAFAVSRPDLMLPKLLPRLCSEIEHHITDDILDDEELDKSLLFYMLILSQIVESVGPQLLLYRKELDSTITALLKLNGKKAYNFTSLVLTRLLNSLVYIYPLENKLTEANLDDPEYLAFEDWGNYWHWKDTKINWHVPSEGETQWAKELFLRVFGEYSKMFEGISALQDPDEKLNKRLLKGMTILHSIYDGVCILLPFWDEEPIKPTDCVVDFSSDVYEFGMHKVDIKDPETGENIKFKYFKLFTEIQAYLEKHKPDDTDAFVSVIRCYDSLLSCFIDAGNRYIGAPKVKQGSTITPTLMELTSLNPWKRFVRFKTIIRAFSLHQRRQRTASLCSWTNSHMEVLNKMFTLCINRYAKVRGIAQQRFCRYIDGWAGFLCRYVTDLLVEKLQAGVPHHEYKGALYVIQSCKCSPILINTWEQLTKIWLALLKSPFSEKNSIIQCMQNIQNVIARDFVYAPLEEHIPNGSPVEAQVQKLIADDSWKKFVEPVSTLNSRRSNQDFLNNLFDGLLQFGPQSTQHWRKQVLCLDMLSVLVVEDIPMKPEVVSFFFEAMVSSQVDLQRIGLASLPWILTVFKRRYAVAKIDTKKGLKLSPGETVSSVLQFHTDEESWKKKYSIEFENGIKYPDGEKALIVHKMYMGYAALPRYLKMKVPPASFDDLSDQPEGVQNVLSICAKYMQDETYIEKLLKLWSLEDRNTALEAKRHNFAKLVARNNGPNVITGLVDAILVMSKNRDQWKQRCVATLVGGFVNGAKQWEKKSVEALWDKISPDVNECLDKLTQETTHVWLHAFTAMMNNRDGNKMRFVLKFMQKRLTRSLGTVHLTSVDAANAMSLFSIGLNALDWRGGDLYPEMLKDLEKYFLETPAPYRSVRAQLGGLLGNVYEWNIELFNDRPPPTIPVIWGDFFERIFEVLADVTELAAQFKPNEAETEDNKEVRTAMLKFKTVLEWVIQVCWYLESTLHYKFYRFIPWLCHFESYDLDPEISQLATVALAGLSKHLIRPQHMDILLDYLSEVASSPSWKARSCVLEFLKVFAINNASIIASNQKWSARVVDIVLSLLGERKLEVRELASRILCGFLHCLIVPNPMEMLAKFKKQADASSKRRKKTKAANGTFGPEEIDQAHSAVLGICAFVDTHPYDVPMFLPDVLVHLTRYLNDPPPIPATVRKCLSNFRRTHHDNWTIHKSKFSEDQLCTLTDIFVSPCYYA